MEIFKRVPALGISQKDYREAGGAICPYCGSDNVFGDSMEDYEGNCISQFRGCSECDATWYATYELSGYVNLEID